jgi:hypothetical protein
MPRRRSRRAPDARYFPSAPLLPLLLSVVLAGVAGVDEAVGDEAGAGVLEEDEALAAPPVSGFPFRA